MALQITGTSPDFTVQGNADRSEPDVLFAHHEALYDAQLRLHAPADGGRRSASRKVLEGHKARFRSLAADAMPESDPDQIRVIAELLGSRDSLDDPIASGVVDCFSDWDGKRQILGGSPGTSDDDDDRNEALAYDPWAPATRPLGSTQEQVDTERERLGMEHRRRDVLAEDYHRATSNGHVSTEIAYDLYAEHAIVRMLVHGYSTVRWREQVGSVETRARDREAGLRETDLDGNSQSTSAPVWGPAKTMRDLLTERFGTLRLPNAAAMRSLVPLLDEPLSIESFLQRVYAVAPDLKPLSRRMLIAYGDLVRTERAASGLGPETDLQVAGGASERPRRSAQLSELEERVVSTYEVINDAAAVAKGFGKRKADISRLLRERGVNDGRPGPNRVRRVEVDDIEAEPAIAAD